MENYIFIYTYRSPIVTGTSVLAIKFDGGIAIAADMLGMQLLLRRYSTPPPPFFFFND